MPIPCLGNQIDVRYTWLVNYVVREQGRKALSVCLVGCVELQRASPHEVDSDAESAYEIPVEVVVTHYLEWCEARCRGVEVSANVFLFCGHRRRRSGCVRAKSKFLRLVNIEKVIHHTG